MADKKTLNNKNKKKHKQQKHKRWLILSLKGEVSKNIDNLNILYTAVI